MPSSFWENNVTKTNSAIPEYGILIFHKNWTDLSCVGEYSIVTYPPKP
jgi:hypothetical protein